MPLRKIISGGQTGADQGGLIAGKKLLLETGGTAPPYWMTEEGPFPELASHFGLVEGPYDRAIYPIRTKRNVEDSDGTVLFGRMSSPGSKLTLRFCKDLHKSYTVNPNARVLKRFVEINNIEVLNVAGNRESKNPGIAGSTIKTLIKAFGEV
ncbi:hypothetical protein LCGC14_1310620 [marine sediment metagenome]|uniref:Molybdenum carrier n=1 Tax=marine sediment metagenome TaxID=412755 RepID=A0A0F9KN20_9ZZZZ